MTESKYDKWNRRLDVCWAFLTPLLIAVLTWYAIRGVR